MEVLAKQRKKLLNLQWLQQVLSYPALGLKVPQSGWSLFIPKTYDSFIKLDLTIQKYFSTGFSFES